MARRTVTRLFGVAPLVIAALFVALAPALAAHDDTGVMTVTATDAGDGATIRLDVGLVYSSDGHHAGAATVTATATGPGGTVGPVAVPHVSGEERYAVDVAVSAPGEWTVAVTSTGPDAAATTAVAVATTPVTPDPTTTEPGSDVTADETPVGVAISEDDDGRMATVAAVAVGGAAVLAIAGLLIARRRRERP